MRTLQRGELEASFGHFCHNLPSRKSDATHFLTGPHESQI